MASLGSLFLALFFTSLVESHKFYQQEIPNGNRVQHPCNPNKFWHGVGHFRTQGGGSINPFGTDFVNAGKTWTRELCMKDSDGDGKTNGQELGDPSCSWTKGKSVDRSSDITHPGVCEPISSEHCKKKNGVWDICASDALKCPSLKEPDVKNAILRFTKTKIPSKVTNYYCQAFVLPADRDYHMIAHEPVIDNAEVMHHALMFGCTIMPDDSLFKNPRKCGMSGDCQQLIDLWSLGSPGHCFPKQFGIKFGRTGYKYLLMQYHWNNVAQRSDLTDASAFRFYYTTKLRPYDGAIMMAGQRYLELPPGRSVISQQATCTSDCTQIMRQAVNFTDIVAHMHYAGTYAEAQHYRNGKKLRDLLKYQAVIYDEPKRISFKEPVVFMPGDEIKMKCYYKTEHFKETMYYGDSTQDEMCFFFMSYYPSINIPQCLNYGSIDLCGIYTKKNGGKYGLPGNIGNCNVADFIITSLPKKWAPMLNEFCDFSISVCRSGCMTVLKTMIKEEPCWKGWARKYLDFRSTFSQKISKVRLQLDRCQMVLDFQESNGKGGTSLKTQVIILSVALGIALLLLVVLSAFVIMMAVHRSKSSEITDRTKIVENFDNPACDNESNSRL